MQAAATMMAKREQRERARARAIVRFNGLMFHGLATASFLETAVPLHVNRLAGVFAGHPEVGLWLERVWWPQRAGSGRALRDYLDATWPEFDWSAAYEEFFETYSPLYTRDSTNAGPAPAALGMCAAEAQAAVFYRALANCADEPVLRALVSRAARDHAGHFDHFRSLYERCNGHARFGFAATLRAVHECSRSAREGDVAVAFRPLDEHWGGCRPFPGLGYREFLERMTQLIERHAGLGRVERLLFRPWTQLQGIAPTPSEVGGQARWFAPVPRLAAA